ARASTASLERALVFVGAANLHRMNLQTQFSCLLLAFVPLGYRAWRLRIIHHRNAGELGNGFLEKLQSFAGQRCRNVGESRDVSPRPREAVNQPSRDRIKHAKKNDRNGPGSVLGRLNSGRRGNNEHVDLESDQLISQRWTLVEPCVRVSILDRYVLVLNMAEIA